MFSSIHTLSRALPAHLLHAQHHAVLCNKSCPTVTVRSDSLELTRYESECHLHHVVICARIPWPL